MNLDIAPRLAVGRSVLRFSGKRRPLKKHAVDLIAQGAYTPAFQAAHLDVELARSGSRFRIWPNDEAVVSFLWSCRSSRRADRQQECGRNAFISCFVNFECCASFEYVAT